MLSMTEIAMVSSRKSRLESLAKKGSQTAKIALILINEPDKLLSTVQIGITLIGILTGIYSGSAFSADFAIILTKYLALQEPLATTIATASIVVIITYLSLILGELVPKNIGMNSPERVVQIFAIPMYWLSKITSPFVWLLSASTQGIVKLLGISTRNNKVTEEEIKAIIQEGTEIGEIQEVEQNIVERVFNLGDRKIESIMTHRSELVWLDIQDSITENIKKIEEHAYTVYPVSDDTLDNIKGVVKLKDVIQNINKPNFNIESITQPAQFFPESLNVYNALEHLKTTHTKYGIVTDEFGSIQGIVTLKDIVNALLGEITEETHEEPDIIKREDGTILVDGQCSFYEFLEYIEKEDLYEEFEYNTISGLVLEILEHIPKSSETFTWQQMKFEIIDMDGVRIDKILVSFTSDIS